MEAHTSPKNLTDIYDKTVTSPATKRTIYIHFLSDLIVIGVY